MKYRASTTGLYFRMVLLGLFVSAGLGCSGTIASSERGADNGAGAGGDGSAAGGNSGTGSGGDATTPINPVNELECKDQNPSPGWQPLLRLTNNQYANTVADLFVGVTAAPALSLPAENRTGGFDTIGSGQTASLALLETYHGTASTLAAQATTGTGLTKIAPCATGQAEATCADTFIRTFGKRVFRRPLVTEEMTRLKSLYTAALANTDHRGAIADTLTAMLLSPQFLYRIEPVDTTTGAVAKLSSHHVAARLSYMLWDTLPDADLFAAADRGALDTPEGIRTEAERLLRDPRAKTSVARFHSQWLLMSRLDNLMKDTTTVKGWTADTGKSMKAGLERFMDWGFWDGEGTLASLMTDKRAFVDAHLAPIYDVPAPAAMALVDVGKHPRAGLLTQAGVLSMLASPRADSPVHRGVFVMKTLLCAPPPEAPAGIPALEEPAVTGEARTTRERQEQTHNKTACIGCHQTIDGIGFGFGKYDTLGRFQESENGAAIDATGEFIGTRDIDGRFDGAVEMATSLAKSTQAEQCLATQWFRYGFGRLESDADACALKPIVDSFTQSKGDLKGLLLTLVTSDAFRYRLTTAPQP
jgi:Protein of unknown function (DUF1592)/Protein of unknown function (DUF1588)/Protein of unknown function (DUF1595)/Protein of unknown function (DUF1587)/Protein of unknown function (DUF1585)